ncbi:hypothetical protein BGZ80_009891 [Entomortierella chlamydospora]|uniref:Uncharacterized protein n=1 Tax=Entomortierella chlamydospora TaxID=101097 RepID=A0A9P6MVJ1_9FUNG|nr:hypothetical protein BGZ80_009891 [Entomortierella chlamydospora]
MSSTAAGRAARKTRREPIIESTKATQRSESPVITTDTPDASNASDHIKTIQLHKDEIEELTDAKARLEDKVTQLEERAQYLEATARLNASKVATEIVDLKEKARKLEIDLSTVVDERDALEQDIEQLKTQRQDAEVKDEARHLSIQLKDAWLKISTMKKSQEELVKKLFNSESASAQLQADLTKFQDLSAATKREHVDDINRWETERQEYIAEISSFKIASLKVKTTALSVQKTAPPEWILEKHQLVEQCATLQSRITTLESERANGGGLGDSGSKKLEADKLKLEKKVETLKAKLVEVMGHAMSIQAEAQEKIAKQDLSGKKSSNSQRRRSNARRRKRSPAMELESDDEVVVVVAEDESDIAQDVESINVAPTIRETRAKRIAAVKNVNYQILSSSSDQSDESEEDDEDNEDQEDDGDGDEDIDDDAEVGMDVEEQDGARDTEMQGVDNETASIDVNKTGPSIEHTESKGSPSSPQLDISSKDNIDDMNEETEPVQDDNTLSKSTSRSRKASVSKSKKATEGSSDSEFEPPKKTVIIKSRSRRNVKKSVSPSAEPAPKKTKITPVNKKRPNEGETPESTNNQSVPATKEKSTTVLRDTEHTTVDSMPDVQPSTSIASAATSSPAIAPNTPVDGEKPVSTEKVKKKRKLLTGKGLEELGDILNGPGSSFSSTPSTGLVFGKGKARLKSSSSTLPAGTTSNPANLEALNAIKMAFTLPKPRADLSAQDKEI